MRPDTTKRWDAQWKTQLNSQMNCSISLRALGPFQTAHRKRLYPRVWANGIWMTSLANLPKPDTNNFLDAQIVTIIALAEVRREQNKVSQQAWATWRYIRSDYAVFRYSCR
jgi:hypothetical protein